MRLCSNFFLSRDVLRLYCTEKVNYFNWNPLPKWHQTDLFFYLEINYSLPQKSHVFVLSTVLSHQWRCPFGRCAARREKACRSKSARRTSAASLSGPSNTEPHHLVNTKHMALSDRQVSDSQLAARNSPSWAGRVRNRQISGWTSLLPYYSQ